MKNCLESYTLYSSDNFVILSGKYIIQTKCISNVLTSICVTTAISNKIHKKFPFEILLTLDYKCYAQTRFLTCCSKIAELTSSSSIPVIVSLDVPGQDFASKYFHSFK